MSVLLICICYIKKEKDFFLKILVDSFYLVIENIDI